MNKRFSSVLVILTGLILIISLFVTPFVSNVSAASEQFVRLVGVEFRPGSGVVFTFEYKGSFDSFKGSALVNGKKASLNCTEVSTTGTAKKSTLQGVVKCRAEGIGEKSVGLVAQTTLNGFAGSDKIMMDSRYCAPIFDWSPTLGSSVWSQQGEHCQNTPINWGDAILYDNPTWGETYWYFYHKNGDETICSKAPQLGKGYYYDCFGIY